MKLGHLSTNIIKSPVAYVMIFVACSDPVKLGEGLLTAVMRTPGEAVLQCGEGGVDITVPVLSSGDGSLSITLPPMVTCTVVLDIF